MSAEYTHSVNLVVDIETPSYARTGAFAPTMESVAVAYGHALLDV